MAGARFGGRVLHQRELAQIYARQKAEQMTTVIQQQNLRRTFLHTVIRNHPKDVPATLFDLAKPGAQTGKINRL